MESSSPNTNCTFKYSSTFECSKSR
ncbi:hypothetical protein Golob_001225 [Gossypium lobatum]|uniref:Uncharacterized protein n=1 Tax=Gossypium lobatum TaxID=34289 RepID=A0A7J8NAV9_9ROSI|nr:hypothetical protein [Gossypium lobatum]